MLRYLMLTLLLYACTDQESIVNRSGNVSNSFWTKPQLEGHWKQVGTTTVKNIPFVDIYYNPNAPEMAMEAGPFEYYRSSDLVFDNDSMYSIDYPMELLSRSGYAVDTGYIHSTGKNSHGFCPVKLVNDTLFVYVAGAYGSEYLKEAYIKTTFNDSIIDFLKQHRVNYPELAGWWTLQRDYWFDYGTHYWLEFPYEVPDSIEISREQFINALEKGKTYTILTGGQQRDYTFWYRWPYLHFTPGKWYEGEDPWMHFERKETGY